jgi:hypothetical protein
MNGEVEMRTIRPRPFTSATPREARRRDRPNIRGHYWYGIVLTT